MIHQIKVYKPSERMPELHVLVAVPHGVACWTGSVWLHKVGASDGRVFQREPAWWSPLPDDHEIAAKLSRPEAMKPEEDPFRIRTHRTLYEAAVKLRDELGLTGKLDAECYISEHNGESDVSFYLAFTQMTPLCRVSAPATVRSDPQLVFDEFERLMRARFAPPEPVPAGLEACDDGTPLEGQGEDCVSCDADGNYVLGVVDMTNERANQILTNEEVASYRRSEQVG